MKSTTKMKMGFWMGAFLLALLMPFCSNTVAFAESENDAVAGCQSVKVDPQSSFEMQEATCNAAERDSLTSCASAGKGMCSSPKKDGLMVDGTNCVCLSESEVVAPTE